MPYPNALPSASLRFAHAPELLLFAVDTSDEAKLPASRPQQPQPAAADAASPSSSPTPAPPPPTRFDALATCALLIARAKASVVGGHRMALLSVGPGSASFVPGSLCGGAQQLEAALSRLRGEALGGDRGGDEGASPFDFATLVDAAAAAAADASSPPAAVRVVLLISRSRAPLPLPRERALDALWRHRHGALGAGLHVDVLFAYDPSPEAATAAQETFSRLEANVDALSAAALAAFPPEKSCSDARARGNSYVLDASVFAARRLMTAACQLASLPLQRPAGARPAPVRDLAKAPRALLPSEAGGGGRKQQEKQQQEEQPPQRADEEGDEEGVWGGPRDEWGLPLPPTQPSPPPPPAHPQLLVDITCQLQRASIVREEPSSFPLMGSGRETTDEGSGPGDDAQTPQPLPLGVQPPPPPGGT